MNNPSLFNAVLAGFSGSVQNIRLGISQPPDYAYFAGRAQALATVVDALIAPRAASVPEARLLSSIVAGLERDRFLATGVNLATVGADVVALWTSVVGVMVAEPPPAATPLWNDLVGTFNQAAASAAWTYQKYADTEFMAFFSRYDQDDAVSLTYQMPHGWTKDGVKPHLHFTPCSAVGGVAVFDGRYRWQRLTYGLALWADWTPFRVEVPIAAGQQFQEVIAPLFTANPPPEAQFPSANLAIWLRRPGNSDPGDTYQTNQPYGPTQQANLMLTYVDAHVRADSLGTAGEFA